MPTSGVLPWNIWRRCFPGRCGTSCCRCWSRETKRFREPGAPVRRWRISWPRESPSAWPWPRLGANSEFLSVARRSDEHTSELQSLTNIVCRLLLEKKKKNKDQANPTTNKHTNHKTEKRRNGV